MAGFLGAVYFALGILRPAKHRVAKLTRLQKIVTSEQLFDSEPVALRRIAKIQVRQLASYRRQNGNKARGIHHVVLCEIAALQALAVAVTLALLRSHHILAALVCAAVLIPPWAQELRRSDHEEDEEAALQEPEPESDDEVETEFEEFEEAEELEEQEASAEEEASEETEPYA